MTHRSVVVRVTVLSALPLLVGAVSFVVVGSALFGVATATFILCAQLLVAIWQESSLLLRLDTITELDSAMSAQLRTLEHLLARKMKPGSPEEVVGQLPALYVINRSQPGIWVIRSLGSAGSIILSRGLFAVWGDPQWEHALDMAIARLRSPGTALATYGEWLLGVFGLGGASDLRPSLLPQSTSQSWFESFVALWKAPLQAFLEWASGGPGSTRVLLN